MWSPYTDAGIVNAMAQPARTRTVALHISKLAEISSDLLISFYQPSLFDKPMSKQSELKKLTDIHTRLESWKTDLPPELDAKEGQLPSVLLMHMFYQLLYIHLYRPFLRFTKSTSPLPAHVSPRKYCTQAASAISKLLRLYKRTHGLRQIINKVVYIAHSACTIHLLNLPDKNAKRDIVHGIKQLEEIGECWTAARRTIRILQQCAEKWQIDLPGEALACFTRTRVRWGTPEPGTGPVSPDTFSSMAQQFTSRPVVEMMAQNVQQQRQHESPHQMHSLSFSPNDYDMSASAVPSPSGPYNMMPSPATYSTPPQVVPESTRNNPLRQATQLTREQQQAWNNLQTRINGSQRQQATNSSSISAASLFGGVESLIGENQDWWFNDQTQLAQGFGNWNAPEPDWTSLNNVDAGNSAISSGVSALPAIGTNGLFQPPINSATSTEHHHQRSISSMNLPMDLLPGSTATTHSTSQSPVRPDFSTYQSPPNKRPGRWPDRDYH